jgi:hypothetical protein
MLVFQSKKPKRSGHTEIVICGLGLLEGEEPSGIPLTFSGACANAANTGVTAIFATTTVCAISKERGTAGEKLRHSAFHHRALSSSEGLQHVLAGAPVKVP